MPVYEDKVKLKVLYRKSYSTLTEHIRWMEYLASGRYFQYVNSRFTNKDTQKKFQSIVKDAVRTHVYIPRENSSYVRSMALLNSFLVALTGNSDRAEISIYSDKDYVGGTISPSNPTGTTANTAGSKGQFSYAAFFEEPAFNTFLEHTAPEQFIRPFFLSASLSLKTPSKLAANEAYQYAIKRSKPK